MHIVNCSCPACCQESPRQVERVLVVIIEVTLVFEMTIKLSDLLFDKVSNSDRRRLTCGMKEGGV